MTCTCDDPCQHNFRCLRVCRNQCAVGLDCPLELSEEEREERDRSIDDAYDDYIDQKVDEYPERRAGIK